MGIKTIAEFVVDGATLEAVHKVGVDYAQDFIIEKPMPVEIALNNEPIDFVISAKRQETAPITAALTKH